MIDSDPGVFSWLVLTLEGEIRAASGMAEVFREQLIITSAPAGTQEGDNGEFNCNDAMWCDTSAVIRVWYFPHFLREFI